MTKTDIVEHLNQAKAAHLRWVQRAHMLIFGFEFDKNAIPVDFTQCNFGKWLYSECQKLCSIDDSLSNLISEIEILHTQLHNVYLEIFKIYFGEQKKGFFENIFGTKKKHLSENDINLANSYYNNLEKISGNLVNKLGLLQKKVHLTPQDSLDAI
ncbi:MAG: CZB domain-containing protein [Sulfurovaceae bacterium]|nr:CZB domain-containing protein [Sulfurovaceae bacterium]MDD5548545.1 CZB domain-containing protein [Sulfurovaceae bacterium]